MHGLSIECPRCNRYWESVDNFEAQAGSAEAIAGSRRISHVRDPPADTLIATASHTIQMVLKEIRESGLDKGEGIVCLHCGPCMVSMSYANRSPGENTALIAGAKHVDPEQDPF